jgi:ADP-ribose pyrophosphatase
MLPRWKKLSSRVVLENPWWQYRKDVFELETGKRGEYHYAATHGSAMVIPVTERGELVLVEQYRYLLDRDSLEFPGGGVSEHESPADAAARELAEETGFAAPLELLGTFTPWNGVTNETCHVYVAEPVRRYDGDLQADDTERFLLHVLPSNALAARVSAGEIWDGMTLAAYALFQARYNPR